MQKAATEAVEHEVERRTGWFRPFCLAVLVLILITTCVVGGSIVLVVRQIVTIPPGVLSALTGGQAPISVQGTTVLEHIQNLTELTTTRFNYSNLVTSQRELPPILAGLYGDRMVMVAVGSITAGIDMRQVTANDITKQGDTMTITLPSPHLIDCFLNDQASYVVSRDTGLFAKPAPNLDTEARRFAVQQFRDAALNTDKVLDHVQDQAQNVLKTFVEGLGVKQVKVVTTPPDPNAPMPDSCQ